MSGSVPQRSTVQLSEVIVLREVLETRTARRAMAWAEEHGVKVQVRDEVDASRMAPDHGAGVSKQGLLLTRHRGAVLKPCTGRTDSLLCCNLRVLTQTVGCPLDCTYCVLQSYQNRGLISAGANVGELLERLREELARTPRRLQRVCTGQVADSLALEPALGFAARAVTALADAPSAILELKTKTAAVEPLLGLDHGGRTVVSWTLNSDDIAAGEELGCAPLEQRLQAAARVADRGYLVAFHLDPMISLGGDPGQDRRRYGALVQRAVAAVPADRLAFLSLGTVRFPPAMRRTLAHRHPRSRAALGELLPDVDGKLRLITPLRTALYQEVARHARAMHPEVFLYLCMEPAAVWRQALGAAHTTPEQVELALARSLHRRFGLGPGAPREEDFGPWP